MALWLFCLLIEAILTFLLFLIFFLLFYIDVPHIAAAEEFLDITFVNMLFRLSGAFFIKRGQGKDPLYNAILTEYMQQLLKDKQLVEFFIEGTRSRSGKILPPKQGLLSKLH
jgi:Glycerol-3-phosphate O-acyltransferase